MASRSRLDSAAVESGALVCNEVRLHGNSAITPAVREQLKRQEIARGRQCTFTFDASDTGKTSQFWFVDQRTGQAIGHDGKGPNTEGRH
mmetsp:Transcript_36533/g.72769  ORF Transcript_36533/g.72769 Transcript_36533/m.72769 type:complete len:89 (+) Transcript_36533:1-267(+)